MSKEKKLIPELRYPEFVNEGEWLEDIVSHVAEYENGKAHEQDIVEQGKYVVVNSKFISTDGEVRKFTNSANCLAKKNEILMVLSDVPNGRAIAKCFHVEKDDYYTVNQRICKITPINIDSKLLFYLLNRNQFFLAFDDGVKQTNLRNEDVLNCPIILPKNPKEQQKIASCLSSLDEVLAAHSQKLELLKNHKKGLMQNLFPQMSGTGFSRLNDKQDNEKILSIKQSYKSCSDNIPKYRFPEFEDDGEWVEKKLGELTLKVGSGVTPVGGETVYKKNGRPFVRSQNVGWGIFLLENVAFIDEETHQDSISTEIEVDDVLLNITGASIGRSAVANKKISGGNVNQHVCIIRTKKKFLNPFFLCQFLISDFGQKQIDSFQAGGNRQGLNFAQIRSLSIPIPQSILEQQKIASCLSTLDALIAAQAKKIEQLKLHKKGLMQGLFPVVNPSNSME
jgi:type I restriction enzyme, S subunit